jgi:hypothetical protein
LLASWRLNEAADGRDNNSLLKFRGGCPLE